MVKAPPREGPSGPSKHGEAFWTQQQQSFGLKLMNRMGWQRGDGLGRQRQGAKQYTRAHFKGDSKGVGSKKVDEAEASAALTDMCNDVLKRLNAAASGAAGAASDPVAKSAAASEPNKSVGAALESFLAGRRLYSKFHLAKSVSNYSAAHMAEILGHRKGKASASSAEEKASAGPDSARGGEPPPTARVSDALLVVNSGVSVADYFGARGKSQESRAGSGFSLSDQARYFDQMMGVSVSGRHGLGFGAIRSAAAGDAEAAAKQAERVLAKRVREEAGSDASEHSRKRAKQGDADRLEVPKAPRREPLEVGEGLVEGSRSGESVPRAEESKRSKRKRLRREEREKEKKAQEQEAGTGGEGGQALPRKQQKSTKRERQTDEEKHEEAEKEKRRKRKKKLKGAEEEEGEEKDGEEEDRTKKEKEHRRDNRDKKKKGDDKEKGKRTEARPQRAGDALPDAVRLRIKRKSGGVDDE